METILNDQNFEQEVLKSDKLVLVDFFATWCPPCQAMSPMLAKLAEESKDFLKVCKIDTDQAPQTSMNYGIQSIPAFILFKNGKEVERKVGAMPYPVLVSWVQGHK